jgi:hypothetical protein
VACTRRFGRVHVTLTFRVSRIRKGGARGLNALTCEVASSASVYPSLRLYVASASEEGAILVSHFGYRHLEKEESRALTVQLTSCKRRLR